MGSAGLATSALDLIGNTRLVALDACLAGPGRILAKTEFLQPGGSVKDRVARAVIKAAYAAGSLGPGQTVVEMTSGNMGAALAVVCGVLGHPFVAVMSAGNSQERARMMRGLGAEVVLVPQVEGILGQVTGRDIGAAVEEARRIAAVRRGYYVDQFNNPVTLRAHEETTGPEIWQALQGRVDAFVACVGTGGSLLGVARYLKGRDGRILCGAVEPVGAEILAGKPVSKPAHVLQGTGYGMVPPLWDPRLVDRFLSVTDDEAEAMRRRLGARCGLYVGFSSAANVVAAQKLLASEALGPDATVVTLLCDTGLKY
jgi:cysteine synthase A